MTCCVDPKTRLDHHYDDDHNDDHDDHDDHNGASDHDHNCAVRLLRPNQSAAAADLSDEYVAFALFAQAAHSDDGGVR